MKKIFGILFLLAVSLPALAQPRLSDRDQQRFDSYYTRWQQYRQVNDQGQIISMEKRMLDVYAHYGIPSQTPFWRVATNGHDEVRAEARHEERQEARHVTTTMRNACNTTCEKSWNETRSRTKCGSKKLPHDEIGTKFQ